SLLIAGYEPRHFLGIAIRCAACGQIAETPPLGPGMPAPSEAVVLERGLPFPPAVIDRHTVLMSREEAARLAALFAPRRTDADTYQMGTALLNRAEMLHERWTGTLPDPMPDGYREAPLAWAIAHYRERLRGEWAGFEGDADMVAMAVIAA